MLRVDDARLDTGREGPCEVEGARVWAVVVEDVDDAKMAFSFSLRLFFRLSARTRPLAGSEGAGAESGFGTL